MKVVFKIIIVLLLFASQSFAQKNYEIKVSGGISFPINPNSFKEYWNSGLNLNGTFGFNLKENVSFDINFEYYNFSFKSNDFINHFSDIENILKDVQNNINVISFFPSINFNLRNRHSLLYPYIYLGLGWMRYSTDEVVVYFTDETVSTNSESKSLMILLAGVGLTFELNEQFNLFIETNYRYGSIDNYRIDMLPVKVGCSINL